MTSPTPNLASGAVGRTDARDPAAASAADAGPFVLNLCSSTTPMALAQADKEELKRFTFFVSRRFEEGRERFRLHMGYFTTLAEAEEWLSVVRDIYPGAWAGEAPGKKLRARAAAAAAAQAQHAQGPLPHSALPNLPPVAAPVAHAPPTPRPAPPAPVRSAPAPVQAAAPVARPVEMKPARVPVAPSVSFDPPVMSVPTVHAAVPPAPPRAAAPPVLAPPVARRPEGPAREPHAPAKPAPVQALVPAAKAAPARLAPVPMAKAALPAIVVPAARRPSVAAHPAPAVAGDSLANRSVAKPAAASGPTSVQAMAGIKAPARAGVSQPAKAGAAPAAAASKQRPKASSKGTAFADSNVREVLAALDDTSETGQTRMMPAPHIPRVESNDEQSLTDTQVLRYLETRRSDDDAPGRLGEEPPDASISLLKPDDTGTRRALKEAVTQNGPVSFAVQLQWAVQPVELDKVPPLAIFSAYTLYTVEGSREGRKWYGLRLGFFSDAISAKQVAYYVRSEFASVAVVPVSPQEKLRATDEDKKTNASLAFPRKHRQSQMEEFTLFDSDDGAKNAQPAAKAAAPKQAAPVAKPAAARPAVQPAAKRGAPAKGGSGRVNARDRKGPQTLEETLEILGASELEIDGGRGESINDTGVRHLRVEIQKNTPFSRLLERLSERTRKN
jgi:hypothetical protein